MEEYVNINAKGNIIDVLKQMKQGFETSSKSADEFQKSAGSSLSKLERSLKNVNLAAFNQNLQNVNHGLTDLNAPGLAYNESMADLAAITGLAGKELDEIGEKAQANAKVFGGNAAKSLTSYKLLLSQLTPELAKSPAILDKMATNVSLLSKTMGGDTTAATEVLTTAMNQYGVSFDNPITAAAEMTRMMNIMSAAAKEGSSELPQQKQAIEAVGGMAKQSGLEFNTLASAVQQLDKAGKKGAEGGTALRSILTDLGKGRFLPKNIREELQKAGVDVSMLADKNVNFTDKMRMLQPVLEKDSELINAMFGQYGQAAAALISTADAQDKMTIAITGTNVTQEQAKVVMESTAEKIKRMEAGIDDAKIAFFEATGGATAYLGPIAQIGQTVSALSPIYNLAKTGIMALANSEKVATASTFLFNAALNMNPISKIITAATLLGTTLYGLTDAFDDSTSAQKLNESVTEEATKAMVGEKVQLGILFTQLKKTNPGTEERTKLVTELKNKYPDLLDQYDLETAKLKDIDKAQKDVIKSMTDRITAQIKVKKATKLLEEIEDDKDKHWFAMNAWGNEDKWDKIREKRKNATDLLNEARALDGKVTPKKSDKPDVPDTDTDKPDTDTPTNNILKNSSLSSGSSSSPGELKRIDVRIQNLLSGDIIINSSNLKEGVSEIKRQVTEALVGSVRDFEIAM